MINVGKSTERVLSTRFVDDGFAVLERNKWLCVLRYISPM